MWLPPAYGDCYKSPDRKPSFPSKTIIALRINPESPSLYPPAITNFRSTHNPYNFLRLKAVHIQYHCARTPSKPLWLHRQNPNTRLIPPNIGSTIAFRLCNSPCTNESFCFSTWRLIASSYADKQSSFRFLSFKH